MFTITSGGNYCDNYCDNNECPHHEGWEQHQCPECVSRATDEQYERARERAGFNEHRTVSSTVLPQNWTPPEYVRIVKPNPDRKLNVSDPVPGWNGMVFKVLGTYPPRRVRIDEIHWLDWNEYEPVETETYACEECGHTWRDIPDMPWIECPECGEVLRRE